MAENRFQRRATLVVKSLVPLPGTGSFTDAFANFGSAREQVLIEITSDLRFTFKWHKSWKPQLNVGDVTITNLSPDTRALFQQSGVKVQLAGGYGDNIGIIGVIDGRVNHRHPNTEFETKVEGRDGGRAYSYGRLDKSYAGKTQKLDVVNDLAGALGLTFTGPSLDLISSTLSGRQFKHGWSANAYAFSEMQSILLEEGLTTSIQDGQIVVLERDGTEGFKAGKEVFEIGPDSGLIESPAYSSPPKPGHPQLLGVKSLLLPQLKIGSRFNLTSASHNGLFKVMELTHEADTYGGNWYTTLGAQALKAGA